MLSRIGNIRNTKLNLECGRGVSSTGRGVGRRQDATDVRNSKISSFAAALVCNNRAISFQPAPIYYFFLLPLFINILEFQECPDFVIILRHRYLGPNITIFFQSIQVGTNRKPDCNLQAGKKWILHKTSHTVS